MWVRPHTDIWEQVMLIKLLTLSPSLSVIGGLIGRVTLINMEISPCYERKPAQICTDPVARSERKKKKQPELQFFFHYLTALWKPDHVSLIMRNGLYYPELTLTLMVGRDNFPSISNFCFREKFPSDCFQGLPFLSRAQPLPFCFHKKWFFSCLFCPGVGNISH